MRFLDYQPREVLAQSLVVRRSPRRRAGGGLLRLRRPEPPLRHPLRGRPVLVAADADSGSARVVTDAGCGVVVPPGRPELLAAAIRRMHEGDVDLEEMGRRGRSVTAEADRTSPCDATAPSPRELTDAPA